MDKPKLKYRFHNPNKTDDELIKALLSICIDANMKRVDEVIRQFVLSDGVKAVEGRTAEDYESHYMRPN